MGHYPILEQWAQERRTLLAELAPRACGIGLARGRSVCGFRWSDDLVVSAAEAVAGAGRVSIRTEHGETSAELLGADLTTDVAVLRAVDPPAGDARGATPRLAITASAGDAVVLVGRGAGGGVIASWSSLESVGPAWRSRRGGEIGQRLDLAGRLAPHLEGAAVFDVSGALLAMAVPGPWRRGLGIPAATIDRVVSRVLQHGHLPRPYLGLRVQSLWLDEAMRARLGRTLDRVALVAGVEDRSPAAAAGVEIGDLLLGAGGQPVADAADLARRLAGFEPGSTLALDLWRGGTARTLSLQVGDAAATPT